LHAWPDFARHLLKAALKSSLVWTVPIHRLMMKRPTCAAIAIPEFLMVVVVVEHAGARFLGRLHE
jgi:hypothetical protein